MTTLLRTASRTLAWLDWHALRLIAVVQESAARRLAAPGGRQPYDLVGTAARTISQAPEDTQQKVQCSTML